MGDGGSNTAIIVVGAYLLLAYGGTASSSSGSLVFQFVAMEIICHFYGRKDLLFPTAFGKVIIFMACEFDGF